MDSSGSPVRGCVTGPLAQFEVGFRAELERMGYTARSTGGLVRVMARLSGWLEEAGLPPDALTPQVVADLRAVIPGVGSVLRFLRVIGVVPGAHDSAEDTPVERVLGEFRAWLVAERGLAAESVRCYVHSGTPVPGQLAGAAGGRLGGSGRWGGHVVHDRPVPGSQELVSQGGGDRGPVAAAFPARSRPCAGRAGRSGAVGGPMAGGLVTSWPGRRPGWAVAGQL